jgi:pyridoxal phosphate enzyme (YggS family)
VSKFQPIQAIQEAYQAGERHFGESRVQELKLKATQLPNDIQWHFIGHLQTNKVRDLLKLKPYIIESVDSKRLLHAINTEAEKLGIIQNILLEVHVAQEETKSGFTPNELTTLLSTDICASLPNIRICGLMSMATNTEDEIEIRRCFSTAATLASNIQHPTSNIILSMGMSDDYKIAMEYGSNSVRIGSSIFGEREYPHKPSSFKAIFFDMDGVLLTVCLTMPRRGKK